MQSGKQWIALDAGYFSAPFIVALKREFGWAGVGVFTAFLCAAKRAPLQGEITYASDVEALILMGVGGGPLVDDDGKPWELGDLWAFAGKMKQTRRKTRGTRTNVRATHWERWQQTVATSRERERKRRQRADSERDTPRTTPGRRWDSAGSDRCSERDTPLSPPSGGAMATPPNGNGQNEELKDLRSGLADLRGGLGWVKAETESEDADAPT